MLLLDELQDQLEQLLVGRLPAAATVAVALRRAPSWLLLLLPLCRLLWRSSATVSTNGFATTHPGRRAVVGVETRDVLGEAEAGSRFGTPAAFVPVPRWFRGRVLERQVEGCPVRRVEVVLERQAERVADKVGWGCEINKRTST